MPESKTDLGVQQKIRINPVHVYSLFFTGPGSNILFVYVQDIKADLEIIEKLVVDP